MLHSTPMHGDAVGCELLLGLLLRDVENRGRRKEVKAHLQTWKLGPTLHTTLVEFS